MMCFQKEGFQGQLCHIVGLDNLNAYYDVSLNEYRLRQIEELSINFKLSTFNFIKGDIADKTTVDKIFEDFKPQIVVNLAAQSGVRYSIENPDAYIQSNIIGFYNILEACRHANALAQSSREASDTAEKSTRFTSSAPGQSPKENNIQDLRDFASASEQEYKNPSREASDTAEKSTRFTSPTPGQSPKENNLRDSQDFVSASEQEYKNPSCEASDTAEKSTRFTSPTPGQSPKENNLQDLRDFASASEQEYKNPSREASDTAEEIYKIHQSHTRPIPEGK